jgi:hypothetical protein
LGIVVALDRRPPSYLLQDKRAAGNGPGPVNPGAILILGDHQIAELGRGGTFSEGYALDAHSRAMLTPNDIGRTLSPTEAGALLARFERKRPPAPSVRRRVGRASA